MSNSSSLGEPGDLLALVSDVFGIDQDPCDEVTFALEAFQHAGMFESSALPPRIDGED